MPFGEKRDVNSKCFAQIGGNKMEKGTQLIIGNWYTQYSAGFWQLIDIKPKYADSDYSFQAKSWKKGD